MGLEAKFLGRHKDGFEFLIYISLGHFQLDAGRLPLAANWDVTQLKESDESFP